MTVFYRHTFTAADTTTIPGASGIAPDIGSTFMVALNNLHWLTTSNRARGAGTTVSYIRTPAAEFGTADYVVSATVRLVSDTGTPTYTLNARSNTAVSSDRYTVLLSQAGGLVLRKTVSGTNTTLGTHSVSFTLNQDYLVQLVVNGSTIEAWLDGVRVVQVTDTSLTTEGVAGMSFSMSTTPDPTTGWHTDTFEVSDEFPSAGGGNKFRPYFITG
jgi:hypothetical protein